MFVILLYVKRHYILKMADDEQWVRKTEQGTINHDNHALRQIADNKKLAKTMIRIANHEVLFPFAKPY